jgi:hypothetical protein
MWKAKTKDELIIEVWEYLDCESVGAKEILEIEAVVRERFGEFAVDSPMLTARKLADEGAELRHPEIMSLYVKRFTQQPQAAEERGVGKFETLRGTLTAIRNLENMRRRYKQIGDKNGLRHSRQIALDAKRASLENAADTSIPAAERAVSEEIARWLTVWLQTPDAFDDWVELRSESSEFRERFGRIGETE